MSVDTNNRAAAREATRHVRQTGHTVTVEQGIVYAVTVKT